MVTRTLTGAVAAVDLGATSGRVIVGRIDRNELRLTEISRFPNRPMRTPDGLRWDVRELYRNALAGIAAAIRREPELSSVGVDSWAADYGLLRDGRLLRPPFHYRDERNGAGVAAVESRISATELYAANGLQHLPFNTVYQLVTDQLDGTLQLADSFLLVPDLINFWLTGQRVAEKTNASTTGLLGVHSGRWDDALIRRIELPSGIFPPVIEAGTTVGAIRPSVTAEFGIGSSLSVVAVGSHDTASAVVAVPATDPDFAYISCGTWSLVGVELEKPVVTEPARLAGFTNEGGVDGRIRFLHNVMGLWLLNETVRDWERDGPVDVGPLLRQAAELPGRVTVFDVDDPRFMPPDGMAERIAGYCREHDLPVPNSRAALVRSILDSLSVAYARTIEQATALTGKTITTVHLVGGGSQNSLLCQLTADRTGLPVVAGPVEATAIGNVLIQARTQGLIAGDLEALRSLVARSSPRATYLPRE